MTSLDMSNKTIPIYMDSPLSNSGIVLHKSRFVYFPIPDIPTSSSFENSITDRETTPQLAIVRQIESSESSIPDDKSNVLCSFAAAHIWICLSGSCAVHKMTSTSSRNSSSKHSISCCRF